MKIPIRSEDLERIRTLLASIGARCVSAREREENLLYDFPDGRLRRQGSALRIRIHGGRALLTYKGPVQDDPRYKVREEFQTPIQEPQIMRKILERLGMDVQFEYSKYRETYRLRWEEQEMEVCLDETPVGTFVEIEGPGPVIEGLAARLGWSTDAFLTRSYVDLYREGRDSD